MRPSTVARVHTNVRGTGLSITLLGAVAFALGTSEASASQSLVGDDIAPAPPTYKANDVTVHERLGAKLPLDARFRTADGALVSLGDVLAFAGNTMPTIVTFNYSDCPMLCNLQLSGLQTALPAMAEPVAGVRFIPGRQFRIVTISLEPTEAPDRAAKMRDKYLARLPEAQRASARSGWTFLVAAAPGDGSQIRRVADAAGFSYTYVPERAEWAHPAALIFLSTTGAITRYVYGIEFSGEVMRESLLKAGLSEAATAVGFMNRCYHYDPDASSHARAGVLALRIGAAGFLVVLVSVFGLRHVLRKRRRCELGRLEMKS